MNNTERETLPLGRYNYEEIVARVYPILLAIDPSVNSLGFACYNMGAGGNQFDLDSGAWKYGTIHPVGKYVQHKWRDIYTKLIGRLEGLTPTHYAAEWPTYFSGQKGMIAAQEGYTIDLAGVVGYLAGRIGFKVDWIALWTPQQWKGSVPKSVTEGKFVRLFGDSAKRAIKRGISGDAIDSIMIAEFWLALYNQGKMSWQHQKTTSKA
jgi:hypothetical protein